MFVDFLICTCKKYRYGFDIYKTGMTTSANKKTGLIFKDIDAGDTVSVHADNTCIENSNGKPRCYENNGVPYDFVESVTLNSGVTSNIIHFDANTTLKTAGNRIFPGPNTEEEDANSPTNVSVLVDSSFSFTWTGSQCGMLISTFDFFGVDTDYEGSGKITEDDSEVLWKENKQIVMTPNPGSKLTKVIIDDNHNYTNFSSDGFTTNPNTGVVTYTFNSVTSNHKIKAIFESKPYKVSYDGNGGTGSMPAKTLIPGEDVTLDKNKFIRTGYTFVGWEACYDNKDKCEEGTLSDQEVIDGGFSGDVTMVAVWKQNPIIQSISENPKTGLFLSASIILILLCGSAIALVILNKKGYFKKNSASK